MSEWTDADYHGKGSIVLEALSLAYGDKHGEDPPDDRYYWARLALTEPDGDLHLANLNEPREESNTACGLEPHEELNYIVWKWPHDESLISAVLPTIEGFCSDCANALLPDFLKDTFMEDLLRDIESYEEARKREQDGAG